MNIAEPFIKRPVMTTLVMLGILAFGVMAYRKLPVSDLPNVDFPTIAVSASLPGASPETMAAAVATPLERQFSTIAGIDNMVSTSSQGATSITIQFTLDRNIDGAAQDVNAAIAQTLRNLPPGIITPSYKKVNPADQPVLYLVIHSSVLPMAQLDEYGEQFMAQRISTIPGVAQVSVFGSQKYAVRIQLDPQALAHRGVGIDEVAAAVNSGNVNMPTGILWGANKAYTVQASGQLQDAKQFGKVIVAYRDGAPVYLDELGQVVDGVQENKIASWFNGTRAIILAVQRQPGTNTVEVTRGVKKMLVRLQSDLPPSVKIETLFDRSLGIEESVGDVKFTLVLTLCLVVMVIFLFLRNVSATVIPSLALPMSIVGSFAVMWALGYSLDNLSLMALTLAVGFVVDDAIVMLENIVRHMEMGKPAMEAALEGSAEIGFTILSMTLSLTAVFIPILFMGGLIGRLFHEFAVTIGVAILVSGFVSLTLTPMLCSRFLNPQHGAQHGRFYNATERIYERIVGLYERTLHWVMRNKRVSLVFSAAILIATGFLFVIVPKGFLPTEDTGQIYITTEAAEGTSFDGMLRHQQQLADIVQKDPYVSGFMSSLGPGGSTSTPNQGRMILTLKPRKERPNVQVIIKELAKKLAVVPGISEFLQDPPAIRIGGKISKSLYQYTLQSPDIATLYPAAQTLLGKVRALPALTDVTSDLQVGNPQVHLQIDRERAASLGVTPEQIESALYNAYGSRQVSTIYTPNNEYWVIMELQPEFQRDVDALGMLYVRSSHGTLVPLSGVATLTRTVGPMTVNHSGQLPSVTISFNLREGMAIGDAVGQVQKLASGLPNGITTNFSGTAAAFQDSQQGLLFLLVLAIFVIYMVLGILYESFIHPLTILSGLPFAAFGALLTLLIFRVELSVYAFVGVVMLVGLVKKNAIMMIDFALEMERQGKSPEDAIVEACVVRFRPIMMTTMAALMGTIPLAVASGAGAESRRPLGITVVGGLAFSQLVTLYVTPVIYTYMDRFQRRLHERSANRKSRRALVLSPGSETAD
ncbi:MAG: efflux RND transporter permease subunit [Gemmatimonadota bacterium]|nr:efflux RND transporter permease subunit [Gemmatimonadota bacterium]